MKRKFSYSMKKMNRRLLAIGRPIRNYIAHFNSCQCTGSTLPYGTDGIWRFMAFGCGWFLVME